MQAKILSSWLYFHIFYILLFTVATDLRAGTVEIADILKNNGQIFAQNNNATITDVGTLVVGPLNEEHEKKYAAREEFAQAYLTEDFTRLETLYGEAVKQEKRLPSGVFLAYSYVRTLQDGLRLPEVEFSNVPSELLRAKHAHMTKMETIAKRWAKVYPESVAAVIFQSELLIRHGFIFRGGGYSSSVAPEDQKKFNDYVDNAYKVLTSRANYGNADPAWHTQVLEVARLQGRRSKERYADILKNAITAFPYFYDIYFSAAQAASPEWGGSAEALETLASNATETTKDREGQSLYARIYWSSAYSFNGDPVRNGKANWPRFKLGFEDIIKRYPDPWNLNNYARFACLASDKPTLQHVFKLIGPHIDPLAWGRQELQRCQAFAK